MNEQKINKIDYAVASLYLFIGGFIWIAYELSLVRQENLNTILLALTFAGPLSLFWLYYKRLRIPQVSIIWFGIGIMQWYILNGLKQNSDFDAAIGSYANYDKTLIGLVFILTSFRIISLVFTKKEFMIATWFSPKDNRKLNILDYVFTFIGFLCLIGLSEI